MRLWPASIPAAVVNTAALPFMWLRERLDDALCHANQPWSDR